MRSISTGTSRPQRSGGKVSKDPKQTNNPDFHSAILHRSSMGLAHPRRTRQTLDRAGADRLILVQPYEDGAIRDSARIETCLELHSGIAGRRKAVDFVLPL